MGFKESLSSAWERGTSSVASSGRKVQLNIQLNDLVKQRQDLAAQLGASLYDVVKDMPELREGREGLLQGIADVDARRAELQAEIAQIESDQEAQRAAYMQYTCTRCGANVLASSQFCSGCGKPVSEILAEVAAQGPAPAAAPAGPTCPQCGAAVVDGDAFCMSCGCKLQ